MLVNIKNTGVSRIGRKLIVAVILFSSVITLVTTAIQIYSDYQHNIERINVDFALVESSYLPSLIQSVWVYNDNQVQIQLEGILGLPGMEFLEINTNGKVSWSVGSVTSKRLIEKEFSLIHHEEGIPVTIGSLRIVNGLDGVYARLTDRVITILINNGIKTLLVAGFMLLFFHYLVTRHLVELAHRLSRFSLGQHEEPQHLEDSVKGKVDEIEQISIAADAMQERITTAYDEVQRSEKLFRELISQMSAGFALHEIILNDEGIPTDYRFLDVNNSFEKLTGLKREEVVGRNVLDILPQTEAYWIETYGKVALTGQSIVYENFSKEFGTYFEVIAYSPQKNQFATIFLDMSERKQAEDTIKQQQYSLEKAQELGQIGTWELDLIRNKLYWTDENCRIFGVPVGTEVNYEIFMDIVHLDDREYVNREWNAALEGKPYDIEHRLVVDDTTKWVREKADVEFDEKGAAFKAIGFTQDITDRKQAAKELQKYQDHLEEMIHERTDELQKTINLMAGREVRMAELKDENKKLKEQLIKTH